MDAKVRYRPAQSGLKGVPPNWWDAARGYQYSERCHLASQAWLTVLTAMDWLCMPSAKSWCVAAGYTSIGFPSRNCFSTREERSASLLSLLWIPRCVDVGQACCSGREASELRQCSGRHHVSDLSADEVSHWLAEDREEQAGYDYDRRDCREEVGKRKRLKLATDQPCEQVAQCCTHKPDSHHLSHVLARG